MTKHFRIRGLAGAAAIAAALVASPAMAADPLVDVDWVKAHATDDGVVLVDFRPKTDFLRGHIPGSVNSDYAKDGWRVKKGNVPGMMPEDTGKLAEHIGSLGIGNDTHVILVPPGASSSDMGTGTRAYWTFKVLGHDEVSILNGGFAAYAAKEKDGKPANPLEKGAAKPEPKDFTVDLQKDMIVGIADVKAAAEKGVTLVDARPADQYLGVNRHGASKAGGTIPGAKNLPQTWTTENSGGTFRSPEALKKLYAAANVDPEAPQIAFCNTGHWASIDWFVASEILGNKDAKMYDGSMTEWTQAGEKTESKISVN